MDGDMKVQEEIWHHKGFWEKSSTCQKTHEEACGIRNALTTLI